MLEPAALLARLDAAIRELRAIRVEVEGFHHGGENLPDDANDLAPEHLIDTTSAAARFGFSRDSIIRWCRQGCGRKVGGRWLADPRKLRAHINGG